MLHFFGKQFMSSDKHVKSWYRTGPSPPKALLCPFVVTFSFCPQPPGQHRFVFYP